MNRPRRGRDQSEAKHLERRSIEEMKNIVEFCREKFGELEVKDARGTYTQPDDPVKKKMAEEMIIGGAGHRKY
jgi:hypothetical protein